MVDGSLVGRMKRRQLIGLFELVSWAYWRAKTRAYYAPQFAAIGRASTIRKPLLIRNPAGITIGSHTFVREGARLEVVDRPGLPYGVLTIGSHVSIEQDVQIVAAERVVVGDHVHFSARCSIVGGIHPIEGGSEENRVAELEDGPMSVVIGSRVFMGVNVVILPNVVVGSNCIIGANSVVTTDIPDNSVVAGSPARVLRSIG